MKTHKLSEIVSVVALMILIVFVIFLMVFVVIKPVTNKITEGRPLVIMICNLQMDCSSKCVLDSGNHTLIKNAARKAECLEYRKESRINITGKAKCTCGGFM